MQQARLQQFLSKAVRSMGRMQTWNLMNSSSYYIFSVAISWVKQVWSCMLKKTLFSRTLGYYLHIQKPGKTTATFKLSLQASTVTPNLPAKREYLIQMKALNMVFCYYQFSKYIWNGNANLFCIAYIIWLRRLKMLKAFNLEFQESKGKDKKKKARGSWTR